MEYETTPIREVGESIIRVLTKACDKVMTDQLYLVGHIGESRTGQPAVSVLARFDTA